MRPPVPLPILLSPPAPAPSHPTCPLPLCPPACSAPMNVFRTRTRGGAPYLSTLLSLPCAVSSVDRPSMLVRIAASHFDASHHFAAPSCLFLFPFHAALASHTHTLPSPTLSLHAHTRSLHPRLAHTPSFTPPALPSHLGTIPLTTPRHSPHTHNSPNRLPAMSIATSLRPAHPLAHTSPLSISQTHQVTHTARTNNLPVALLTLLPPAARSSPRP